MATSNIKKSSESSDSSSSYSSTRKSAPPRRHRSLSRFSHRLPDPDSISKGKFVNTVRGSGFGEVSLDDLAVEFFETFSSESGEVRRGRSISRGGLRRLDADTESSRRRRSLSRQPRERVNSGENSSSSSGSRGRGIGEECENVNTRRQRSVSVVRCRIDSSESDVGRVQDLRNLRELKSSNDGGSHKQSLGRSFSRHTPIKYHDGYSSHSSAVVTDDEGKDSGSGKHGTERIIQTATPKKRESLGNSTKLRESEECKRDLLAEIMLEEQLSKELQTEADEKPSKVESLSLTDEAEQYIDEFISNIEDTTDFSSFEDERSETKSSQSSTLPVEMDGVMLPWLQWETPDDTLSALECLNKSPHTPTDESTEQGMSIGTKSSRASCSSYHSVTELVSPITRLKVDVTEYLKRPNNGDILNGTWKLRHRISSGSLVLCNRSFI